MARITSTAVTEAIVAACPDLVPCEGMFGELNDFCASWDTKATVTVRSSLDVQPLIMGALVEAGYVVGTGYLPHTIGYHTFRERVLFVYEGR